MSRGINRVIIIGNAGADPEMRQMPNGDAVTNLRLAVSESWTDKNTGSKQERTEWIKVVLFKKLGEICAEYVRKGNQVYIEGQLRTRKYQDKEGRDCYSTEVIANQMQMLGSRNERDAASTPASRQPASGKPASDTFVDDDLPW